MVNRNLLRGLDLDQEEWQDELAAAMGSTDPALLEFTGQGLVANKIVKGRVLRIDGEFVLVDVGYKSEGSIPRNEWDEDEEPTIGQEIDVLVEETEDTEGQVEGAEG